MTFDQVLRRKAAAFVLTAVAVLIPCSAWYVAGSRQLRHEADAARSTAHQQGYKVALKLAERLSTRLEVLRATESRRPFYHYQNLYHDPRGAAQGLAVSVSPLAEGPGDPLVEAYFQVDAQGHLSLPTLNEDFPELSLETDSQHCALLWKLRDVTVFFEDSTVSRLRDPSEASIESLSAREWRQHLRANELYSQLKYQQKTGRMASGEPSMPGDGEVEVSVGPLEWHALPIGGEPTLVAVRSLQTPAGRWLQGFLIDRAAVEQVLEGHAVPAVFALSRSGQPDKARWQDGRVPVDIGNTGFAVEIDVARELAVATQRIATEKAQFLRSFALGALAAGMAGLLLILLVFQSERLAQQRIRFAASAAHELRTPLAGLRLYGEMLAEGLGDPGRAREYARRMAGEAERLGRVVTNVLSFTRLERGGLSVHPQPGDVAAPAWAAIERQRPALEQAGIQLEAEVAPELPPVLVDADAVGHIVQNLLDNAEKYTREVENRRVDVALAPRGDGGGVELVVADNGPGVPAKLRRKLFFEPFLRGNDADGPEGLGLGLVLVKTLVEAQNAKIWYEDAPGGGALFRVFFPSVQPTAG